MDKWYFRDSGWVMQGYRLYFMDRFSGHIDHRRDFLAGSDAEAIVIADGWFDGTPMELWLRGHKLKRWDERPIAPLPVEDASHN